MDNSEQAIWLRQVKYGTNLGIVEKADLSCAGEFVKNVVIGLTFWSFLLAC